MPTNLAIDDRLLARALKVGGRRTKRETVNIALEEFIQRRRQLDTLKLFGKVRFDPRFDYRKARNAR